MPSLETVLQKAMESVPEPTRSDQPKTSSAPTESSAQAKTASSTASESIDSDTASARTAFEHELLQELKDDEREEFDALSASEQQSRLTWMKRRIRSDARQKTEYGKLRKMVDALDAGGVTAEDLSALIHKRRNGSTTEPPKLDAAIARGFTRKLSEAKTPEEREAIKEAEQTVKELVEDLVEERLGQRLKPLEEKLDSADRQRLDSRRKHLDTEINDLEEVDAENGKDGFKSYLIEHYRDDIRSIVLRNPDWSARKALYFLASDEEITKGKRAVNGTPPASSQARSAPVVKAAPSQSTTPVTRARKGNTIEKTIANIFRRKL